MSKKSLKIKELIDQFTSCDELITIKALPRGIENRRVSMDPCLFIGPRGKIIVLYNNKITVDILEKIYRKALKDDNKKAGIALLRYAIYNKKTFWNLHRRTALGIQVMAEILGQHG